MLPKEPLSCAILFFKSLCITSKLRKQYFSLAVDFFFFFWGGGKGGGAINEIEKKRVRKLYLKM